MKKSKSPLHIIVFAFSLLFSSFTFSQPPQNVQDFITHMMVRSTAIIATSDLAMQNSTSQEVRGYAKKISSEYMAINERVKEFALDQNVPLPDRQKLTSYAGDLMLQGGESQAAFDVAYGRNQVPAIEQIIRLLQSATEMDDQEVKGLADSILPQARRHLLMAEQLFSATSETKTDIYQNRENQIDEEPAVKNNRVPTTERTN
jgi:putative membrane protein